MNGSPNQAVEQDLEKLDVSAAERELLDERWAAFLRDPSSALSLDEFKDRVKTLRA